MRPELIQKEWQKILEDYRQKLVKLKKNQDLTLDVVKSAMAGVTKSNNNPKKLITLWENKINSYEANGKDDKEQKKQLPTPKRKSL